MVDVNDSSQLADALRDLISDHQLRDRLVRNAENCAAQDFDAVQVTGVFQQAVRCNGAWRFCIVEILRRPEYVRRRIT